MATYCWIYANANNRLYALEIRHQHWSDTAQMVCILLVQRRHANVNLESHRGSLVMG